MINNSYARAYSEVLEILKYIPQREYVKIPKEKIKFYKDNMDKNYIFKFDPETDLSRQNISPQANAVLVNLYKDYLATEKQKVKIKEILDLNQKRKEKEKSKKYNSDNMFKK